MPTTQSGTVSRTVTPSVSWMTSLSDSRCWTLTAEMTLIPSSSNATTSSHRLPRPAPGTFVWASSSTIATCGRRAMTASTSISSSTTPRYSMRLPGDHLEIAHLRRRLGPAVRLDEADHHVHSAAPEEVRLVQHAVGLAYAGRGPDVDLEPAALPRPDEVGKGRLGGGAGSVGHAGEVMAADAGG